MLGKIELWVLVDELRLSLSDNRPPIDEHLMRAQFLASSKISFALRERRCAAALVALAVISSTTIFAAVLAKRYVGAMALEVARLVSDLRKEGIPAIPVQWQLPAASGADVVLKSIARRARQHDLSLTELNVRNDRDERREPAAVVVSIALRGGYPNFKAWLADVQAEHPEAYVSSMGLKPMKEGRSLEIQTTLIVRVKS